MALKKERLDAAILIVVTHRGTISDWTTFWRLSARIIRLPMSHRRVPVTGTQSFASNGPSEFESEQDFALLFARVWRCGEASQQPCGYKLIREECLIFSLFCSQ
jgi:hypothetical protein